MRMKHGGNCDPCLKKYLSILRWSTAGVFAAYAVLSIVLALAVKPDFFDGWFTLLGMGFIGLVLSPVWLAVVNFIRYRLTVKYSPLSADMALDRTLSGTAFATGISSLALFLADFLRRRKFKYPWDDVAVGEQIRSFAFVALLICVAALVLHFATGRALRFLRERVGEEGNDARCRLMRRVSVIFLVVLLVGLLLVPMSRGTYHDGGGSQYYKAVLYEVIDWDRGYAEGAMQLPDDFDPVEEQRGRIYFFPINCYAYEAKWDMKH